MARQQPRTRPYVLGAVTTRPADATTASITRSADVINDADRPTPFGGALRSASLDELPELRNVLLEDLSLVGPRPLMMHYLERYTPQQARPHRARPGVTGLAQVSSRNALTWEQKFAADIDYVNRRSLLLDFSILVRTLLSVLRRDGISAVGDVTRPELMGSAISDQST